MRYAEYKRLPNRLRKFRIERNLKPKDVAEILGLKFTSQLSQWESGRSLPSLVTAFKLAGAYKVMVEDLYIDLFHKARKDIAPKVQEVYDRVNRSTTEAPRDAGKDLTN